MSETPHTPTHDLIPFATATHLVPGRPNISTLWRWARKGVRSRGGEKVRLRHVRLGGRLFTSAAWVLEFGEALAAADAGRFAEESEAQPRGVEATSSLVPDTRSHLDALSRELQSEGL